MAYKYFVTAKTGSNHCDSENIKIKLGGTLGVSPDPADGGTETGYVLNSKYNDFEGGRDTFQILVPKDIGEVVQIWLTGDNSDHWSVVDMNAWKDGEQDKIHTFDMNILLKGDTVAWWANGVSQNTIVNIQSRNQDVYKYTDFSVEQNASEIDTTTKLTFSSEYSSEVSEGTKNSRTSEHSWFAQASYSPPDASGGFSYGAGYAGSVAKSIERSTGVSHRHTKTASVEHVVPLKAKKYTAYQVAWHEVVTTGTVELFDGTMKFRQVKDMVAHFDITGTYDSFDDIPKAVKEGRRVVR